MNKHKESMFKNVVENAFCFLQKSMEELTNEDFKYSIIHFYSAVELFLKARLMYEHWTLIIDPNTKPNIRKFIKGDFISINYGIAKQRLEDVLEQKISKEENLAYENLREDRNRMIHFYHQITIAEEKTKIKTEISSKQLIGLYFLRKRLLDEWGDIFKPWKKAVSSLDEYIAKYRNYFDVVYNNIKSRLDDLEAKPNFFVMQCDMCEKKAVVCQGEKLADMKCDFKCEVCGFENHYLNILCRTKDCGAKLLMIDECGVWCASCKQEYEIVDVVRMLKKRYSQVSSQKIIDVLAKLDLIESGFDGDYMPIRLANCSVCDSPHTVIDICGAYLCVECEEEFDHVEDCEWCGEPNTGDMEGSFSKGCSMCDGILVLQ